MKLLRATLLVILFYNTAVAQSNPNEPAAAKITDYKKKSVSLQEKEREILSSIYKMTRKQRKLALQKSEHLEKREELESDVADLEKNIEFVSEQIKKRRKKIASRTRNLYKINAPTIFQTIFGSQNLSEMDRNARILYKLSKSEIIQLRDFRGLKNLLDQQQQELEVKLSKLEKTQKDIEKQEKAIKDNYYAQMDLLKKLEAEDKLILSKLKNMKLKSQSSNSAYAMFAPAMSNGLYEKKGQLDLPVAGIVTQKFGLLPLQQEKIKVYHKGWFITCVPGKDVYSVHPGSVVFVGILEERKTVVMVDHGDHFYSVYANLQSTLVSIGDQVSSLDVIGTAGTSRLFGHGLYFEIRHFSQSEDPMEWFDENRLRISSVKESSI
jgi:murein hydrolase activator